jgi:2'-5' RNA ligase
MSRIRTFIAIDPGKEIRARLVALQGTLARTGTEVKWVEPENLHVTLLFLGEVDERDLPDVCKAVADAAGTQAAFTMSVEAVKCFGSPRRPRTVWAGVGEGTQAVVSLHDAIERPLLELGCYRREERLYTPHITLGRVRGAGPADKLAAALAKNAGWQGGETPVREVHVMGSELKPEGPVYTVLSRAKLG